MGACWDHEKKCKTTTFEHNVVSLSLPFFHRLKTISFSTTSLTFTNTHTPKTTLTSSSPMAAITAFSALSSPISPPTSSPLLSSPPSLSRFPNVSPFPSLSTSRRRKIPACSSINNGDDVVEETRSDDEEESRETLLLSVSPLPLLLVATLPGGKTYTTSSPQSYEL